MARIVDMHCDTISALFDKRARGEQENLRQNSGHVDLLRMKKSGYLLQNFALFVELGRDGDPWERVCNLYEYYREELEKNGDLLAPVFTYSDLGKNDAAGKISSLLTVEEGAVCKGEIGRLRSLYDMGVRMLTITWNFENELGSPNFCRTQTPNLTGGLTDLGREFVAEMERLGMIPDVSHLSDAGFYDVLNATKKPFVASHSNARAVCGNVRNLTDDMICKLSEKGGCMGLNFYEKFLGETSLGEPGLGTMDAVVRQARHIVNVGGIEVLGLGSDFDGIATQEELSGVQSMEALWEALRRGGFTEGELDKIFYENVLRVYRETL